MRKRFVRGMRRAGASKRRVFWYATQDYFNGAQTGTGLAAATGIALPLCVAPEDAPIGGFTSAASQAPQNDRFLLHAIRGQLTFWNLAAGTVAIARAGIIVDELTRAESIQGAILGTGSGSLGVGNDPICGTPGQVVTTASRSWLWFDQELLVAGAEQRTMQIHIKTKRVLKQGQAAFLWIGFAQASGAATCHYLPNIRCLLSTSR